MLTVNLRNHQGEDFYPNYYDYFLSAVGTQSILAAALLNVTHSQLQIVVTCESSDLRNQQELKRCCLYWNSARDKCEYLV